MNRNKLLAKLHIIMAQQGVDKEVLYSSYGVTSATQLSDSDLVDCISKLENTTPCEAKAKTAESGIRQLRSDVLSLITRPATIADKRKRGLGVPNDWAVLNPFIKHHGGDYLPKLSMEQLLKLRRKLWSMRESGWYYGKGDQQIATGEPELPEVGKPVAEKPKQIQLTFTVPMQPRGLMS